MLKTDYRQPKARNFVHAHACFFALFVLACLVFSFESSAAKSDEARVYKKKYAAFVIDAQTGFVLYQDHSSRKLHPASLTKMMTLLMVFDAMDRGRLKLSHNVRISKHAASMIPSKLDLPVGSTITIKDAIYALVTKSANDVAVAIAEKLGGTEANFARLMTNKARRMGMKNTTFKNASGLHDKRQVTTARDMAKLARAILKKHSRHYHYFSTKSFTYKGKTYKNHNKLLETYPGTDGFKTGYIKASGFNLVSSAVRDNRRLIGVVFGGKTGKLRNAEMERIMDISFTKLNTLRIAHKSVPLPREKPSIKRDTKDIARLIPAQKPTQKTADDAQVLAHNATNKKPPAKGNALDEAKNTFKSFSRWAILQPSSDQNAILNRMSGEGDVDTSAPYKRIEAGLIAISSHLGHGVPTGMTDGSALLPTQKTATAATLHLASASPAVAHQANPYYDRGSWQIQIGAFSERERTHRAIAKALRDLPENLQIGISYVAPINTQKGWIYRARLKGYSKTAAYKACDLLQECLTIAPNTPTLNP